MGRARQRPEEIIGEWGIRDVTPASQKERRELEADRDLNPLVGRPLPRTPHSPMISSGRRLFFTWP